MIGPHEGKELALMLAWKKALALFHDILPADGHISEEIIPERAFAPHVRAGTILRFSQDIYHAQREETIRYVAFAMPGEAWRAAFVLWLKAEWLGGRIAHDPAHDALIGRLLGYDEQDIAEFLQQFVCL